MPTGYTSKLYEGEQDFEDFAMGIARAFGAFAHQRDDSFGAEPKLPFYDPTHDMDLVDQAERELEDWKTMESKDIAAIQSANYTKQMEDWEKATIERAKLQNRYECMLEKVKAWDPPSDAHVGYKDYMIEQLEQSIKFDCSSYGMPRLMDVEEYRREMIQMSERILKMRKETLETRKANNEKARQWGIDLFESLGISYEQ